MTRSSVEGRRLPPAAAALLALLACLAAAAALAAPAGATVYCVDAAGDSLANEIDASCEVAETTIQGALTSAAGNAGEDTVLLGPGEYTLPAKAGGNEVEYGSLLTGNLLHLRGLGNPHLTMGSTAGSQVGLFFSAPEGSTLEDLHLTIPANEDGTYDSALRLGGGAVASGLTVDGPAATNTQAVSLYTGTRLVESTVDMPVAAVPTNQAVQASNGDVEIADSFLRGYTGVTSSGNVVAVERTTIDAHEGSHTDGGTIVFRDSLIELGERSNATGVNLANGNMGSLAMQAVLEGVTIVGGALNSVGVRVQADNGSESAEATISSTVIEGPPVPLEVRADNGREAKATAAYSNYDGTATVVNNDLTPGGETGTAVLEESEVAHLEPGFVDAAAGDFHLKSSSPLIDRGDPASPPAEELDIDKQPRARSAVCPLAAGRRDIGADEFVPTCASSPPSEEGGGGGGGSEGVEAVAVPPDTKLFGKRRVATRRKGVKLRFRLTATAPVTRFRCKVDGRARRCGASFRVWLKRGKHRITAVAVGTNGAVDPTPAKLVVRVVKKK